MEQTDYLIIPIAKFEEILTSWQENFFGKPTHSPQYHQLQSAMYNLRANLASSVIKATPMERTEPLTGTAIDSDPLHKLAIPDEQPDAWPEVIFENPDLTNEAGHPGVPA